MTRIAPVLIVLGVVLGALGLTLGFTPLSRDGVTCGSVFRPNDNAATVADLTRAMEADQFGTADPSLSQTSNACDSARSDRKPLATGLVVPGAVLLVVGGGMLLARRRVKVA